MDFWLRRDIFASQHHLARGGMGCLLIRSAKNMRLWRKKPIVYPKITIEGIEVRYRSENPEWSFTYKNTDFISYSAQLVLPSFLELDAILRDTESLRQEMLNRCKTFTKEYGNVSEGELLSIHLDTFVDKQTIEVSWCAMDDSWGDMGVDFIIKNGIIEDECWGD